MLHATLNRNELKQQGILLFTVFSFHLIYLSIWFISFPTTKLTLCVVLVMFGCVMEHTYQEHRNIMWKTENRKQKTVRVSGARQDWGPKGPETGGIWQRGTRREEGDEGVLASSISVTELLRRENETIFDGALLIFRNVSYFMRRCRIVGWYFLEHSSKKGRDRKKMYFT